MAKSSQTQTIALLAIGGFVLYEIVKSKSATASGSPLQQGENWLSSLFGGGSAGGSGSNPYGAGGGYYYNGTLGM